jgi:hypothetical protein
MFEELGVKLLTPEQIKIVNEDLKKMTDKQLDALQIMSKYMPTVSVLVDLEIQWRGREVYYDD